MPSPDSRPQPARRALGLLSRRERWGLTARGWMALIALLICVMGVTLWRVHPFLAVTAPVDSRLVVVEAWVPPAILKGVATRFAGDDTRVFYCTGGPTDEMFESTRVEDTSAAQAARFLHQFGVPESRVKVVPTWVPRRDRTYSNAVALRDWFKENGVPVTALNVVTEGPHARRSRLMFEKAFGDTVEVGVISIEDPTYEAAHWYRFSEGIKAVISESAGYVYARFFFRPGEQ